MLQVTLFGVAGLVIPSMAGFFLFGEPLSLWQCLGMGLLLWAVYTQAADAAGKLGK